MSTLFNDNPLPYSPTPSVVAITERAVERIKDLSKSAFEDLVRVQREGIDSVWNHPTLTPQQIVDGLGDNALKVFQFHGGLTDYIKTIAAVDGVSVELKYPSNAFTVNEDGSITITSDPYIIP